MAARASTARACTVSQARAPEPRARSPGDAAPSWPLTCLRPWEAAGAGPGARGLRLSEGQRVPALISLGSSRLRWGSLRKARGSRQQHWGSPPPSPWPAPAAPASCSWCLVVKSRLKEQDAAAHRLGEADIRLGEPGAEPWRLTAQRGHRWPPSSPSRAQVWAVDLPALPTGQGLRRGRQGSATSPGCVGHTVRSVSRWVTLRWNGARALPPSRVAGASPEKGSGQ